MRLAVGTSSRSSDSRRTVASGGRKTAGEVAARLCQAGDKPELDRVLGGGEYDRNGAGFRLGRERRRGSSDGDDHRHLAANEFGRHHRQPIDPAVRPAVLDRHVLALEEACIAQGLTEGAQATDGLSVRRRGLEEADHRHGRLLRAGRERPRHRGAGESNKIAPSQLFELHF